VKYYTLITLNVAVGNVAYWTSQVLAYILITNFDVLIIIYS